MVLGPGADGVEGWMRRKEENPAVIPATGWVFLKSGREWAVEVDSTLVKFVKYIIIFFN